MADHLKPTITSTYSNFVTELDARFDDLAVGLDPAVITATNVPTGSIRWTSASNKWQKFNGTAYVDLSALYSISISGNAGTVTNGIYTTGSYSNPTWITALSGTKITGDISGNSASATKLFTARNINGIAFDGTANVTTVNWGTARTITIGATGKSVDGSANVVWTVNEILSTSTALSIASVTTTGNISASGVVSADGNISSGGDITAVGNISASSDETLKINWRELPDNFVNKLAQVRYGIYDRIDTGQTQVGVSAQSLRTLLPDSVSLDNNNKLAVAYGNAALVSVIELAKEIEMLKQEIKAMKGATDAIKS